LNEFELNIDASSVNKQIISFIETQVKERGDDGVLVWFSGYIDSTTITKMCLEALGPDAVKLIIKPQKLSDNHDEILATSIEFLGVSEENIVRCDVEPMIKKFGSEKLVPGSIREISLLNRPLSYSLLKSAAEYEIEEKDFGMTSKTSSGRDDLIHRAISMAKTRSRFQMAVAYYIAETENRSLVGTINKTELLTGLFTKWGQGHCTDIMPLGNLFRTQILQLAEYLEIPDTISSKRRTDMLPGVENKYIFFFDLTAYEVDRILHLAVHGNSSEEIYDKTNLSKKAIEKVIDFYLHACYTRGAPLMPKF
jgi:NAD+ synthase